jgi:hypothetical protein
VGDPWTPPPGWGQQPGTRRPQAESASPPGSRIAIPVVAGTVGLILGAAAMAAGGSDTTTAAQESAQPRPTVTVTVTAAPGPAPEPTATVTVTATAAATPRPVAKPASPPPKPTPKRATTPAPEEPPASAFYENCAAARAAGAAPLYRGEPGYRSALDRDHDGMACE